MFQKEAYICRDIWIDKYLNSCKFLQKLTISYKNLQYQKQFTCLTKSYIGSMSRKVGRSWQLEQVGEECEMELQPLADTWKQWK